MGSPLDVFAIVKLIELGPLSPTNYSLYLCLSFALFNFVLVSYYTLPYTRLVLPSNLALVGESLYASVLAMSRSVASNQAMTPLLLGLFGLILLANLVSNIPYNYASTSALTLALGLSLTVFLGVTLLSIQVKRSSYLAYFVPAGAPNLLLPLLVQIELVSYCARALSLGVRLFANITAGHCLLGILSSMTNKVLLSSLLGVLYIALPTVLLVALVGLEVGVALIQAYVFVVLSSIYIQEATL